MKRKQLRLICYCLVLTILTFLTAILVACGSSKPASTTQATSTNNNTVTTSSSSNVTTPIATTNATHPAGTLTSIIVTPTSPPNLKIGFSQQFAATANYSDGSTADITADAIWASSDTSIAAFLQAGSLLTGMKSGTANITASLGGKTSPPVSITVVPLPF
jgi:hypothetical protein